MNKCRYILTALFSLTSTVLILACSCFTPPSLCEYSKYLDSKESQIIFIGTVVEEVALDSFYGVAYKVEIEEVIRGTILTGDAFYFDNPGLVNTVDEVWLLGGSEATCLRYLDGRILIATESDSTYFGYQPSICQNDTYAITSDNEITGFLWDKDTQATISVDNIDEVLNGQCTSGVDDFRDRLEGSLDVFPNPTSDRLMVVKNDYLIGTLRYRLQDIRGRYLLEGYFDNSELLSLQPFADGVYILTVYLDGYSYSRRIVKQ